MLRKTRFTGIIRNHRKSVFFTLLLSFIMVLLLPVIIGTFLYVKMERVIVDNAGRSNIAMLEQVRQQVDNQMQEVKRMMIQIALDPKLQVLISNGKSEESSDPYKFFDFSKDLSRYINANSFINDFFIYFQDMNMILSPSIKTDPLTYYNSIRNYKDMNYDQFRKTILESYYNRTFLPSRPVNDGSVTKNMITFVQSLPLIDRANLKGNLVIYIDEEQVNIMLKQIEMANNAAIYIFNENNELIMSTSENHNISKDINFQKLNVSGSLTIRDHQEKMLLSYTTSEQNGWKFIAIAPQAIVMSNATKVKLWAIELLIACLTFGIVISYYLAYRNYTPVREVVHSILKRKNGLTAEAHNEFEFIKLAISNAIDEENHVKNTMAQQIPVIRANFLSRLIRGHLEAHKVTETSLKFMDIQFNFPYFGVIIIHIDDCRDFVKADMEQDWVLVRFITANISMELLQVAGYAVDLERDSVVILTNQAEPSEKERLHLKENIRHLKEFIEQRFKIQITISTSNLHQGIDKIGSCYEEAMIALDYKMIKGQSTIINYEDIRDMERHYYHYPIGMDVQLLNYAKARDYAGVERLLDHIYEVNFQTHEITPEIGKYLFLDLLSTFMKLLNSLKVDQDKIFIGIDDPIKYILNCVTAEEMLGKIKVLYSYICNYEKTEKTDHSERLYNRIIKYIESYYHESGLSLVAIADSMEMNPSYLSTFFKSYSGNNITDYIASIRVQQAKQLLTDPSLTLTVIASKVGYANDVGLIRIFKKHEGITPGKYREINPNN